MDYLALDKIAQVEFRFKGFQHNCLPLSSIELIKHVTCEALEFCIYIVFAHANRHLHHFSHQIEHTVFEVQDHREFILISFSIED